MNRLIIESVEGRILTGIVMIISIMVLIGWVAINEPARMAEFDQQFTGRSIERGAELFAANCSTCHGANGLGIGGRAPGLNSPHLFGYDYLAEVNGEIGSLQREIQDINDEIVDLEDTREDLFAALGAEDLTDERQAELVAAIQGGDARIQELNARIDEIEVELEPLLVQRDERIADLQPAITAGYLPELDQWRQRAEDDDNPLLLTQYIAEDASRLAQIDWGGDLASYLNTTLVHGRPGSSDVWNGNAMVAWSQAAGGPLRPDQIENLVDYMLNWDKGDNWTADDFAAVSQYAKLHVDSSLVAMGPPPEDVVGTNGEEIVAMLADYTGDATRGEQLYLGAEPSGSGAVLGCAGCHNGGAIGPATIGTWSRTQEDRLTLEQFEGYSVEQYLVESIVAPNDYISPGYVANVMNQNYGEQITYQDMADILAFLESQG